MGIITNELCDPGHGLNKITNIQIKKYLILKTKTARLLRLPLFFIDLKPRGNNGDVYNTKLLCHQIMKIEPSRKK